MFQQRSLRAAALLSLVGALTGCPVTITVPGGPLPAVAPPQASIVPAMQSVAPSVAPSGWSASPDPLQAPSAYPSPASTWLASTSPSVAPTVAPTTAPSPTWTPSPMTSWQPSPAPVPPSPQPTVVPSPSPSTGATYATAMLKFTTYIYANSKAPKSLRFVPHDKGFDSAERWEATVTWTNETLGGGQPKGYVQLTVPVMVPLDVWQIAEDGAHVLASPSKFTISQDSATQEWAPPDIWLYNVE